MLPDDENALKLAPPQLAGWLLLEFLAKWRSNNERGVMIGGVVPNDKLRDVPLRLAYTEAWSWLVREGLLLPDTDPSLVGAPSPHSVPSRDARKLLSREEFETLHRRRALPREHLHKTILGAVETDYFNGDYDAAVLKAFRRVEIAVRTAAGLADAFIGTKLMREAFDGDDAPLRHNVESTAERDGMGHLFVGAIALYSNSTRHRDVGLGPEESVELFVLASHLLRIVDSKRPTPSSQT